jgi:hypothetical protein
VIAALLAVDLLLVAYPSATARYGGLSPEEARDRHALTFSVRHPVALAPSVDWIFEVSSATHWHAAESTSGSGLVPAGLRVDLGPVALAALGGVWLFDEEFPVPGAGKHAFTGEVEIARAWKRWTLGLRFSHWSNAGTAARNPGLNAYSFVLGWSL